jgi:tetratricopeptide (TPR) repeat protein/TolB-like protein
VAVLPLADETADPALAWTAAGVADMLSSRLSESADLRVVDPVRVLRTLRALQLTGGRYDDAGLRRVGSLLEVDRLVSGSIRRAGQALRVDVRVVTLGPAGALSAQALAAQSPGADGLFTAVDGLGAELRARLGGATPLAPEPAGPGTGSPEAAAAYRQGRAQLLMGDAIGAAPLLEKATALDPRFAAALERLAEAYQQLGYQDKALAAAEQAAVAAGTVETRLGYRVRARVAMLKGEPAEAEKSYAELARRYPGDSQALLDLASAQQAQGDLPRAVATLERAAAVDGSDPRTWFLLGRNAILTGRAAKAASDYLVRALALQTQLGNQQGQADVENALGIAYHELGDYPQALEKYGAAAEKRGRLGDRRGVAGSRKNRGRTYIAMGRLAEAEPDLLEARRIYEAIGDTGGQADTWNEFGVLEEGRGRFVEARRAYQEALKLRRSLGDERALAQSYDNVGYVFMLEGEYDNALVYAQQALERRQRIGDEGGAVRSMQTIGFVQTALGRWNEAIKAFEGALQKARALDLRNAVAVSQGNIGVLQHYQGQPALALSSLDDALATLKPLDDKRGLAEFTVKQAAVLLDLGALPAAREKLDAAAAWIAATGNREQSSDQLLLRARWHAARGEREDARRALARAVEDATASHSPAAVLRARLASAEAALEGGDAAEGVEGLDAQAEALGEAQLSARAAALLARAQLARGRTAAAEASARRALRVAGRIGWEAELFRLHALLARVLERKGDRAAAAAAYEESARGLAALRAAAPETLRAGFDAVPAVREARAGVSRAGSQAAPGR